MAKVLVVEDEWIVADQICSTLRKFDHLVLAPVSTGDEAIQKIDAEKPDLVIMDVLLHGSMDGVETANQILSKYDIPVLYLTAYSSQDLLERVMATNPAGYLVKPFEENELKCNVEIALHNHRHNKELRTNYGSLESNLKKAIDAITDTIE